jgi:lipopolysaccharide transport system ATP-binding protein
MSNDVVIRVEEVSKQYRLGTIGANTVRGDFERWWARLRGRPDPLAPVDPAESRIPLPHSALRIPHSNHSAFRNGIIWALRDVSFEVKQGEVLGIIGRNGAGKSTLLKLLARVTAPTSGRIKVRGRLASLLEVGTGFHPELTGRENIYLNGAILGMRKAEIDKKFDEIVDFSGVEQFIDTPVKRYSSGMYVRLAFAVAAHLDPEILLVDEVLAVGDAAFQRKCVGKMGDVAREGRTVLFVSHNMAAIIQLSERGILVDQGHIVSDGPVTQAVTAYQAIAAAVQGTVREFPARTGTGKIKFKEVALRDETGGTNLQPGRPLYIDMLLALEGCFRASQVRIGLGVNGPYGERLVTLLNEFDPVAKATDFTLGPSTVVVCKIPRLLLRPGVYFLSLYIDIDGEVSDRIKDALALEVREADFYGVGVMPSSSQGPLLLEQEWSYSRSTDTLQHR